MVASRRLQRAAIRQADHSRARAEAAAESPFFTAKVTTVTPGASIEGVATIAVTYHGVEFPVNGYPDTYTPALNHMVRCAFDKGKVYVHFRAVGEPA